MDGRLHPRIDQLRALIWLPDDRQSGPEHTLRARFTDFLRHWEGDEDRVLDDWVVQDFAQGDLLDLEVIARRRRLGFRAVVERTEHSAYGAARADDREPAGRRPRSRGLTAIAAHPAVRAVRQDHDVPLL